MKKICFLGLSGSGKTCYLYYASHLLAQGYNTAYGPVSILSKSISKSILLNDGIEKMTNQKVWPRTSDQTTVFPYELYIGSNKKTEFEIFDYRGGVLYDESDNAQDERDDLFETFQETNCIVVFIDAYTLMSAFFDNENTEHQNKINSAYRKGDKKTKNKTQARNELNHIKVLINEARRHINNNVTILLTITKKDLLSEEDLNFVIKELKNYMNILFAEDNPNPVGITAIALGKDLGSNKVENGDRVLTGNLLTDVSLNLHIPILFPLFLSNMNLSPNEKEIAKTIFKSNYVQMYINGEEAIIKF